MLHRSRNRVCGLLIMLLLPLMVACPKTPPTPPVLTGPDPAAYDALVADNHRIAQTVREQERMLQEYEARIHRLQLQLLESDARHQAQQAQLSVQQDMLDEAVVEVVRTKAKLRSIESRAEAASSMAEAEIALKGLAERIATNDGGPPEDYLKAEALLRMSTNEFKKKIMAGPSTWPVKPKIRSGPSRVICPTRSIMR
jgi:septal ring factor EnvC (AmiA/AmiB activator)